MGTEINRDFERKRRTPSNGKLICFTPYLPRLRLEFRSKCRAAGTRSFEGLQKCTASPPTCTHHANHDRSPAILKCILRTQDDYGITGRRGENKHSVQMFRRKGGKTQQKPKFLAFVCLSYGLVYMVVYVGPYERHTSPYFKCSGLEVTKSVRGVFQLPPSVPLRVSSNTQRWSTLTDI